MKCDDSETVSIVVLGSVHRLLTFWLLFVQHLQSRIAAFKKTLKYGHSDRQDFSKICTFLSSKLDIRNGIVACPLYLSTSPPNRDTARETSCFRRRRDKDSREDSALTRTQLPTSPTRKIRKQNKKMKD